MSETYNLDELSQHFTLELNPGNLKEGMKANGATSNDLWKFPVKNLRPIEGFNVRVKNAAYWARVHRYADSMIEDGYWSHKPMAGYIGRDKETGEEFFFFTAGYTRRDAIDVANSKLPPDKQIEFVTVVAHPGKTITRSQLNALLITENDSAKLEAYEASVVVKRMFDDGDSVEEIARQVRYSTEWVDSLLLVAAAPTELQLMVVDDVIKPTFAIETIKEHGDKALTVLQEALARKTGSGEVAPSGGAAPAEGAGSEGGDCEQAPAPKKVRLTAKDLIKPEVRKFNNKVQNEAVALYRAASNIKKDAGFNALTPESREALLQVLAKLEKYEVQDEPATDPRQVALFEGSNGAGAPAAADTTGTADPT